MIKKTPLMEQFEKENPNKHAIWNGEITEQFKIWKEKKQNTENIDQFLFNKDGFIIEKKSDVIYCSQMLEEAVNHYGLSQNPDWKKLQHIGQIIFNYMKTDFEIDLSINREEDYHEDIMKVAEYLASMNKQNLKSNDDYTNFCKEVIKRIKKADLDGLIRLMAYKPENH